MFIDLNSDSIFGPNLHWIFENCNGILNDFFFSIPEGYERWLAPFLHAESVFPECVLWDKVVISTKSKVSRWDWWFLRFENMNVKAEGIIFKITQVMMLKDKKGKETSVMCLLFIRFLKSILYMQKWQF